MLPCRNRIAATPTWADEVFGTDTANPAHTTRPSFRAGHRSRGTLALPGPPRHLRKSHPRAETRMING
jgi:hypothetical protein